MSDTIYVLYTKDEKGRNSHSAVTHRELPATQFSLESARDLSGHVSRWIPATTVIMNNNDGDGSEGDEDEMFYEKIIVIKDDSLPSLSSRLYELMRYEVCRRVNFGLFIGTASREQVAKAFVSSAKKCLRSVRDANRS